MEKSVKNLIEVLEKKGFDTEKKVCTIDLQVAVDNGLTAESKGILALQKAIKTHSVYSFLTGGKDTKPDKKEAKKNADDDRAGKNGVSAETYESSSY